MRIKILFVTSLLIVGGLFLAQHIIAQESELPSPGLTPDSPFYFLDKLSKKINLFFTLDPVKKAKKATQYAEERIAEAKVMAEENKSEATEKANEGYQKFLDLANIKTQEAKEQGRDVEELATLIIEKTLKHQRVLVEVFEKVPEETKTAIQEAIETSRKGSEEAVQAVTGEKKEELLRQIEEIKVQTAERIRALEEELKKAKERIKELEKGLEEKEKEVPKEALEVKTKIEEKIKPQPINSPPSIPTISGPTSVIVNTNNLYSAVSTDPDGNDITYTFDWGDGTQNSKSFGSGYGYSVYHAWTTSGIYTVKVTANDNKGGVASSNYMVKVSEP